MTPAARERMQVRMPLLLISGVAWLLLWILLVARPGGGTMHHYHVGAMPREMMLGWALMLVAMMSPVLIAPVRHVRDRSFVHRRGRAIVLFTAGYFLVWMVAGAVLLAWALAVRVLAPESYVPVALIAAVAMAWQSSPGKQRCLNRCHAHAEFAAFGRAADLSAVRFGLSHGVWCVGSCWALMLLPLLVSRGHLAVMIMVTLLLFAERLDRPIPPRWRLRGPVKAVRIAVAQVRRLATSS